MVQHVYPEEFTTDGDDDTIAIFDFNPFHIEDVWRNKEHILASRDKLSDDLRIDIFGWDMEGPLNTRFSPTGSRNNDRESCENICSKGNIFRFDVVGRLPYIRYRTSNWSADYYSVFIDQERLICVQVGNVMYFITFRLTLTIATSRWTREQM